MGKIKQEYMQRLDEEYLDWKHRLIIGKSEKKVDLSWKEISELLGLGGSTEYLRKVAYGIVEYRNWNIEKRLSAEDESDVFTAMTAMRQLEDKKIQLEKEKVKLQDQRRQLRADIREWARAEKIKEDIQNAVKEAANVNPIRITKKAKPSAGDKEAAILFSDWHRGSRSNNHWNLYSDVEFEKRVEKTVLKTIEYGRAHGVRKLHVFLMGDMINGLIHVTTRIENMEHIVRSTKVVAEVLSQVLARFANEFEEILVYSVRGNHDRVTPNKNESVSKESFFDFIPWYLEARLENVEKIRLVENEFDDEIAVAEICGSKIFAVHGHKDRIHTAASNLSQMLRIFPDFVFMGHYHHHEEVEKFQCEVIVNSSLSGTDEYAKDGRMISKPAQKFIVFDNEEGRLCTYNIRLDNI